LGLFLAALAAFSIALGQPHVALAANESDLSAVDKLIKTPDGKAALARVGLSEAKFNELLGRLSPDQKKELASLIDKSTPKSRLTAKMIAAGYTAAEAKERLALLSDDEIAKLADDPDAMTAGTQAIAVAIAIVITLLILWVYFATEPAPEPAPSPAPAR